MTETQQKIYNALPYFTTARLSEVTAALPGMAYGTIRGNLRDMRKAGTITNNGKGWMRA